jgi:regulatory protein
MKQWGRIKIKYELQQKKVSEYCIKKALKQISEDDYLATLKKLAEGKYNSLKGDQYLVRKKKTMDYLMQKGYEPGLIQTVLSKESE